MSLPSARIVLSAFVSLTAVNLLGATPAGAQSSPAISMDICPDNLNAIPDGTPSLTCGCSSEQTGDSNTIWGDNPYAMKIGAHAGRVCRAAVHAGAIGLEGGQITVTFEPEANFFPSTTRNGVGSAATQDKGGFRVANATAKATPAPIAGEPIAMDICPDNLNGFPADTPSLTCGCSSDQTGSSNTIWGDNPYSMQLGAQGARVCRAAVHAGAIATGGGEITVIFDPQANFFPATTRNGVESASTNGKKGGFRIANASAKLTASPVAAAPIVMDICPDNLNAIPSDTPSLTCGCSSEQTGSSNTIWGDNPYSMMIGAQAARVCRAAVHAGAIGLEGGEITVAFEPEANFFPATTRNGVKSASTKGKGGFRVTVDPSRATGAAPAPSVDASGKPVQAPIAETLKAVGKVQLYINFATDKDKPLPTSEPVLQELLATLQDSPQMRVMLTGHTDSQGSASYNLDLSQRRAASVYLWLIQHGMDSDRLRSDGRGLMEPIADNDTESGRALNRRVEVKTLNQ